MIWLVLGSIASVALLILGYPFLSAAMNKVSRKDGGLSVYTHQLSELEAEVAGGLLTEAEAEPAKIEIQRRMLRISRSEQGESAENPRRMPAVAIALLIVVPLASFSLYSYLGSPGLPSKPLASRDIATEKNQLAGQDLNNLVSKLAVRLQQEPENLDGWILLARTLSRMGRYDEAADTYLQATKIAENDADLYVGAGENFYFHAEGEMTEAALNAFETAFQIDAKHPGARYYLALRDAQSGRENEALDSWVSLYNDSDASAPFMKIVRGRIEEVAEKLGRDVSAALAAKPVTPPASIAASPPAQSGPSAEDMKAAANMSANDRQQMIRNMVARLADRMAEAPEYDGLMRLGQVYGTLKEFDKSAEAYSRAATVDADNPAPLALQAFAIIQNSEEGAPPPEQAIDLYRKVLELDNSAAEALWYVGIAEARAGNRQAALDHWKKLQSVVPEGSPLQDNVRRAINALSPPTQN